MTPSGIPSSTIDLCPPVYQRHRWNRSSVGCRGLRRSMTVFKVWHQGPGKIGNVPCPPHPGLTLAALNAAFAPDGSRWRDDDWAAGFDPKQTLGTTPRT